jgi:hypothetical protein
VAARINAQTFAVGIHCVPRCAPPASNEGEFAISQRKRNCTC